MFSKFAFVSGLFLLVLANTVAPSDAASYSYAFKVTFDRIECDEAAKDYCADEPFVDLVPGATSTGFISGIAGKYVTDTDSDYSNEIVVGLNFGAVPACSGFFGEGCPSYEVYGWIHLNISDNRSSFQFGDDPRWEFEFKGDVGKAVYYNYFGAGRHYLAYFDLSEVTTTGIPSVPLPASLPLIIFSVAGIGMLGMRKKLD